MADIKTIFHYDRTEDRAVIERVQDVEPVLDYNARLRQVTDGYNKARDMKHVAEVPMVLIEKWANEAGISVAEWMADPENMRRQLNDPANKFLRIGQGRL